MLGMIQSRSLVVAQQPAAAAANAQVEIGHPVAPASAPVSPAGAVAPAAPAHASPAGRPARMLAQLAGLPARAGHLGARTIIGGAATGVGLLTAGSGVGALIGTQIQAYSQGHFAEHEAQYAYNSTLTAGMAVGGLAVAAAGLWLTRSAPPATPEVADNQAPTAPSTPGHGAADNAV